MHRHPSVAARETMEQPVGDRDAFERVPGAGSQGAVVETVEGEVHAHVSAAAAPPPAIVAEGHHPSGPAAPGAVLGAEAGGGVDVSAAGTAHGPGLEPGALDRLLEEHHGSAAAVSDRGLGDEDRDRQHTLAREQVVRDVERAVGRILERVHPGKPGGRRRKQGERASINASARIVAWIRSSRRRDVLTIGSGSSRFGTDEKRHGVDAEPHARQRAASRITAPIPLGLTLPVAVTIMRDSCAPLPVHRRADSAPSRVCSSSPRSRLRSSRAPRRPRSRSSTAGASRPISGPAASTRDLSPP